MKFEFSTNSADRISADILLVFAYASKKKEEYEMVANTSFELIDKLLEGQLSKAAKIDLFKGKKGEIINLISFGSVVPSQVVLVGLGEKDKFNLNELRKIFGTISKKYKLKADSITLSIKDLIANFKEDEVYHAIVEGVELGNYTFHKYKKEEKKNKLQTFIIAETKENPSLQKIIAKAKAYSQATILARDLVNEQPTVATPSYLADLAMQIAESDTRIKCKIFEKKDCEKMGMEAFLGIARASATPPKFIYLQYTPKIKTKETIALVGKGITFDSGGINVKPGDAMKEMKMDMSGAAAVLGVFSIIGKIKPKVNVIGLIAATPNLIAGTSLVPGDVVKALNGKTIEILNTDAEGRVTMADSLSYAVKEGATQIIDFATLTGACMVALGEEYAGLFSNNEDLAKKVQNAAEIEGELVWPLPLADEYKEQNESSVADIANIPSSRYGGAITAALFLKEFVNDVPWVHLDIAGPAFAYKDTELSTKGGTGRGVRTALRLLEEVK